jgi:hypothetical protein
MTGSEMIEAFRLYYDRITSFSAPGYLDDEILIFLNNAQNDFIKERVFGKDFQPPAMDDNQKRVVDLFPLSTMANITSVSYTTEYVGSYNISKTSATLTNVLYTIGMSARVTRTNPDITQEYVLCRKIKIENVGRFLNSATNKTHFVSPVYIERHDGYYIIADNYTTSIDRAKIDIVRKPQTITETIADYNGTYSSGYMSLHTSVHQEIVDMAVRQALQVSQDPRWQSSVAEGQIKNS